MTLTRTLKKLEQGAAVTALAAVLAGSGAAAAGAATGGSTRSAATPPTGTGRPPGAPGKGGPRGMAPMGKVTAVSSGSLTIAGPGGGSHQVVLTSTTTVTKDGAASAFSSLAVGEDVVIDPVKASGTAAGTLTAATVHIVASLPKRPPGGGRGAPPGRTGRPPAA